MYSKEITLSLVCVWIERVCVFVCNRRLDAPFDCVTTANTHSYRSRSRMDSGWQRISRAFSGTINARQRHRRTTRCSLSANPFRAEMWWIWFNDCGWRVLLKVRLNITRRTWISVRVVLVCICVYVSMCHSIYVYRSVKKSVLNMDAIISYPLLNFHTLGNFQQHNSIIIIYR